MILQDSWELVLAGRKLAQQTIYLLLCSYNDVHNACPSNGNNWYGITPLQLYYFLCAELRDLSIYWCQSLFRIVSVCYRHVIQFADLSHVIFVTVSGPMNHHVLLLICPSCALLETSSALLLAGQAHTSQFSTSHTLHIWRVSSSSLCGRPPSGGSVVWSSVTCWMDERWWWHTTGISDTDTGYKILFMTRF